jgi:hypothetical protein
VKAEIASLFHRWRAALATGDADAVANLYASYAVLEFTASIFLAGLQGKPLADFAFRDFGYLV